MKRILFALQVFGLIAILPLCVVLEMNHGAQTLSAIETRATTPENMETSTINFSGSSIATYQIATSIQHADLKTKKKCSHANCSCADCKCGNICSCIDF